MFQDAAPAGLFDQFDATLLNRILMTTADTHCWSLLAMSCQRIQAAAQDDSLIVVGLNAGLTVSPNPTLKVDWDRTMGNGVINFLCTGHSLEHPCLFLSLTILA